MLFWITNTESSCYQMLACIRMKKIGYIILLAALLSSCKDPLKNKREEYCETMKEFAMTEIKKGNIEPVIKGKYFYSKTERYFIWKKYGINIIYPIDLHEFYQIELDSCYNSIMLKHTTNKEGIIRDLDSLTTKKNNKSKYDYPKLKYIREYHDEKFYVGLYANNKDFAPKRIDTSYFDKLEKFQAKFNHKLSDTIKCEFWYEIDTLGNISSIEIYHHSTPIIDSAVVDFYSSFTYTPANDGFKKLEYRSNDFIYFLGTMK